MEALSKVETSLEWQEHFSQFQNLTDVLPGHIHLPVCLWIMGHHCWAAKKNMSHGNEVLLQDTAHPMKRPLYYWGSLCQDPAGNQTTQRHYHRKEIPTEVAWTCLPFITSGQKRGKDYIRDWTGLEFAKSQRAVENREKWRKLVENSSVVPQQPSWLRDRWNERFWPRGICLLLKISSHPRDGPQSFLCSFLFPFVVLSSSIHHSFST